MQRAMRAWFWLLAAAASGTVDGTVTDSVTGAPVKRALVMLRATGIQDGERVAVTVAGFGK